MELARSIKSNIDITTEIELLSFTYTGINPIEVISRVDLGDTAKPIVGGAPYSLSFFIDGAFIAPASIVDVPLGETRAIMVSRAIPIETGDVISVRAKGTVGDTTVNVVSTLRDNTPILRSEILGGGEIIVDHDYPNTDDMRVTTPTGEGIRDADVKAYLSAEYNTGSRQAEAIRGQTKTDINGRWISPFSLSAGNYTLVFSQPGRFLTTIKTLSVT